VPHLLRQPASASATTVLINMPIVSKQANATSVICVVKNSNPQISSIKVLMKNTTVQRVCSLSGSFNGTDWFVINDSIMLQAVAETKGDKTTCTINFPPSSYGYLKLVIDSKKTDPVNIIGIMAQASNGQLGTPGVNKVVENPPCTLLQKDSGNISYIRVTQSAAYQFENIGLLVSGVKYFNRTVDICIPQHNNHSFSNTGPIYRSFTISNNSTLQFTVPAVKATVFYLLVHNDDNLPVKITAVKTAMPCQVLTAYLERGNYRLLTDNEYATPPVYDITMLSTSIPSDIAVLGMQQLKKAAQAQAIGTASPKSNSKLLLWGSIAAVLVLLLLFAAKLTRDVNRRTHGSTNGAE
jgi:hypothetical protein